jgi:hypothetical protein
MDISGIVPRNWTSKGTKASAGKGGNHRALSSTNAALIFIGQCGRSVGDQKQKQPVWQRLHRLSSRHKQAISKEVYNFEQRRNRTPAMPAMPGSDKESLFGE